MKEEWEAGEENEDEKGVARAERVEGEEEVEGMAVEATDLGVEDASPSTN